jgi:2-iminobutanoate/2-iminopropanoate deaminase
MCEIVLTDRAPLPIGPYSQAVKVQGLVFVSGQIPLLPGTGQLVEGGMEAQARQVLKNLSAILEEAGSGLGQVVKTTVFLTDLNCFSAFNQVYEEYFGAAKPARATVEVARLPMEALVEIEAIATAG